MLRRPATQIALTQEDIVRYEETRAAQQAEKAAARERKGQELGERSYHLSKGQNPAAGESLSEERFVDEAVLHESRLDDQHEPRSRTLGTISAQEQTQQQRRARVDASGSPSAGNISASATAGASRGRPVAGRARHMRTTSSSRGGRATVQTDEAPDRTNASDEARQRAGQRRARIMGRGGPANGSLG